MEEIQNFVSQISEHLDFHTFVQLLGDFSEPINSFFHNVKAKYMGSIKIFAKLFINLISLIKLLFFWYMLRIFDNKDIQLEKLINLENYPIIKEVWPLIQQSWTKISFKYPVNASLDHEFINECRNITLDKALPHKYITKSLKIYTIAKVATILLGFFELYKLMFKTELEEKLNEKSNEQICQESCQCKLTPI